MKEEWRCVLGLPKHYQVSNLGGVRALAYTDRRGWKRKPRTLRPIDAQVELRVDGKRQWCAVAALVLRAFVGPMPAGCRLARHLDDNRDNNKVTNLAWGTDADNIADAQRNGRSFVSRGHQGHKHTPAALALIGAASAGRKLSSAHKAALAAGYQRHQQEKR